MAGLKIRFTMRWPYHSVTRRHATCVKTIGCFFSLYA